MKIIILEYFSLEMLPFLMKWFSIWELFQFHHSRYERGILKSIDFLLVAALKTVTIPVLDQYPKVFSSFFVLLYSIYSGIFLPTKNIQLSVNKSLKQNYQMTFLNDNMKKILNKVTKINTFRNLPSFFQQVDDCRIWSTLVDESMRIRFNKN